MNGVDKIKFSFEYYDIDDDEYCMSCWSSEQIKKSLKRLREINEKSFNELTRERRVFHFYQVRWEKTTKPNGFPDQRLKLLAPYHFALLSVNQKKARVYGAFSSGVFYIVWFDLEHNIWPIAKKNT